MKNIDKHNTEKWMTIFLKGWVLGVVGMSSIYYLILFLVTGDPNHPYSQFVLLQPFMGVLIFGFGIQMGLYWMMRHGIEFSFQEKKDSKMTAGTSTAVSGAAMVACCAHHVADLVPILGLSAAAIFLTEYQQEMLMFGILANAIGIVMMLWFITGKAKPREMIDFFRYKQTVSLTFFWLFSMLVNYSSS